MEDEQRIAMGLKSDEELSKAQREKQLEELEAKERDQRAWNRLCGMAGPLGRQV